MISLVLAALAVVFAIKNMWTAMAICLTLLVIFEILVRMKD